MRKNTILFAIALVGCSVLLNSCSKVVNGVAQSIGWEGIDVTIDVPPSTAVGTYATVGTGTFNYNLDSFIKSKTGNLLGMKNIDEFKFKSCRLTILNPTATNSFADFSDAKASFYTNINSTPALLGEVNGNPDTYATMLDLPVNTTTNMRPYLPTTGAVTIMYDVSGSMRRVRTAMTQVQIHIEYDIHVTP